MTEKNSDALTANRGAATGNVSGGWREWAVLIYLGGQNNLFDEMIYAVKEMKSSVPAPPSNQQDGKEFNFHALVQFAAEGTSRPTSAYPLPRRFILKPGDSGLGRDYYPTPTTSTGQSQEPSSATEAYKEELIDFLVWGITNTTADYYAVIFSGHGLGIESDFLTEDTTPPRALTVKDLREVLRDDRVSDALGENTIDVLGLDSCLMAMAEVGYELREEVSIMISSQGSEANLGWPYKEIFASMHDHLEGGGHLSPQNVAAIIMDAFVHYYDDFACAADSSADIAAWRLRDDRHYYMDELKAAVDSLAKACLSIIRATNYKPNIWDPATSSFAKSLIFAHWYAQTYHSDQYVDISDLCDVLRNNLPDCDGYEEIKKSCDRIKDIVSACNLRGAWPRRFSGHLYQYSYGVSIYFPWSEIYPLYHAENLDFLKYNHWYEFIQEYTTFTRRPPRDYKAKDIEGETFQEYGDKDFPPNSRDFPPNSRDFPPNSRGGDDPTIRAKNPPSLWKVGVRKGDYQCNLKKPIILE